MENENAKPRATTNEANDLVTKVSKANQDVYDACVEKVKNCHKGQADIILELTQGLQKELQEAMARLQKLKKDV